MTNKRDPLANALNVTDHGETILTQNTTFSGSLKCEGPVKIYGILDGEVETAGPLIVGRTARVTATIFAHEVGVAGIVVGNITAIDRVEIYAGGKVYGDVLAKALTIEEGAAFSGQSTLREQDPDPFTLEGAGRLSASDSDPTPNPP